MTKPTTLHRAVAAGFALAALLVPSLVSAGGSDLMAESRLNRMAEFYQTRQAMAATVDVVVGPSCDVDESVEATFRFFAEGTRRLARASSPESEIAATAIYDQGKVWTNAAPAPSTESYAESFEEFLDQDRCGYWLLMNQFADPRRGRGWLAQGSRVVCLGIEELEGAFCLHLAIDASPRRYELWIALGPSPVALKATLASSDAPSAPVIAVRYNNWRFNEAALAPEHWPAAYTPRLGPSLYSAGGDRYGPPTLPPSSDDPVEAFLNADTPPNGARWSFRPSGGIQLQAFYKAAAEQDERSSTLPLDVARDERTRLYLDCLQGLEEEYRHCGVTLLGVRVGYLPPRPQTLAWREELGWSFETVADPIRRTAKEAGVRSLPALVVVGPDGKVAATFDGSLESLRPRVQLAIERLLGDKERHYAGRKRTSSMRARIERIERIEREMRQSGQDTWIE